MFAQVIADFGDRVREVNLYFQMLQSLDNEEIAVVRGRNAQVVPPGLPPPDWGRMQKGAAYLILYNLVEAFIRRGFQAVFDCIQSDGLCGIELTELMREQWVMQKNRVVSAFDGSPKVYMTIANRIVMEIASKEVAQFSGDHLPISGNLDADLIRKVCSLHGVSHATDPAAKGGAALTTVKQKRNSLSHGDESFVECGRVLTVADLVTAKDEIVHFVTNILTNLERFATSKGYKL
jgi:hypothetical protein